MIEYIIIIVGVITLVLITWLLQPYRNWKKNFNNREYEPIVITDLKGIKRNINEYHQQCNKSDLYLSLVVPSYNEEKRIPIMMDDTIKHMKKIESNYEFIIVNDGSKDKTTQVALQIGRKQKINLVVVQYPKNRGKGGAVRAGMAITQGKYVLMVDADGATTFSQIDKVLQKMKKLQNTNQHEMIMVVGSRRHLEQQEVKVERKLHRKFMSAVFKFVISFVCGIKVKDTQCGFKLFTKQSAKILFQILHIERFAFDVQLFFLCNKFNICTAEVGVEWHDVDDSKLNLLDASINMFRDVLMIRLLYLTRIWKYTHHVKVK